jgi:hypothetical protein
MVEGSSHTNLSKQPTFLKRATNMFPKKIANEPQEESTEKLNEMVAEESIVKQVKMRSINELQMGNYFGELSLLTNLRRTATIYSISATTCGWIETEDFHSLVHQNSDIKAVLVKNLNKYKDSHIKFLITMVKNVPQLRRMQIPSLRALAFILRDQAAPADSPILRTGQII